jgi:hypothetical protein
VAEPVAGPPRQQRLEPGLAPEPLHLLGGDQVGEDVLAGDRVPQVRGVGQQRQLPERLAGGQRLDQLPGVAVGGLPQLHRPLDDQVQVPARAAVLAEDAGAAGEVLDLHRRRRLRQHPRRELVERRMPGQEPGDLLHVRSGAVAPRRPGR